MRALETIQPGGRKLTQVTSVETLLALLEISQAASASVDELTLASSLVGKIRSASRMDACVISRWERESTWLTRLAQDGIDDDADIVDIADFPVTLGVLRSAQPRAVQAQISDGAVAEAGALTEMGARTLLMLPLTVAGEAIGLIELISFRASRLISGDEMEVYQAIASAVAAGLRNARLLEHLRLAADIDQVTGVHNHRYLQERLRQEVARVTRSHGQLCVLMLDLDGFKPINDRFGHADGDRVLRNTANILKSLVRTNDVVARYGGDEFVVVLSDTPGSRGQNVARRVITGIREHRHELSDGSLARVDVSCGIAVYPDDGRTATMLLQAADLAMYADKRARSSADSRRAASAESEPPPGPRGG